MSDWEARMAEKAAERQAERWAAESTPLTDADLHTFTIIAGQGRGRVLVFNGDPVAHD